MGPLQKWLLSGFPVIRGEAALSKQRALRQEVSVRSDRLELQMCAQPFLRKAEPCVSPLS